MAQEFAYLHAGRPAARITLRQDKTVVWANPEGHATEPHGFWSYVYDQACDLGQFKLGFHWKGDEMATKTKTFNQVPGSDAYRDEHWTVVLVRIQNA